MPLLRFRCEKRTEWSENPKAFLNGFFFFIIISSIVPTVYATNKNAGELEQYIFIFQNNTCRCYARQSWIINNNNNTSTYVATYNKYCRWVVGTFTDILVINAYQEKRVSHSQCTINVIIKFKQIFVAAKNQENPEE
jgi:hypothetical protein